jgi:DNA-binding IclR family transcriptional regulator
LEFDVNFSLTKILKKCKVKLNSASHLQYSQHNNPEGILGAIKSSSNQGYKTLKDLAKIISLFNTFQVEERSVSEISKTLGMLPSKVSRMLRTIETEGFFERNSETGKYRLGIGFFELGMVYAFNFPLRKIVRPHIEQMAKELNMTASCGILKNCEVIVIDRVQNLNIDLLAYRIGLNLPIHSTSVGKILLAYLSEQEQDKILQSVNLMKFTDATVVDQELIKENLKLAKERGYATDEEETHEDLNCIAAPIRNGSGEVIAAINLMDEKNRTSAEKLFGFAGYLKEKALFISRQLGYGNNL